MARYSMFTRRGLVIALTMLAALIRAAIAQDRSQVEIVPSNPHTGVVTAVALSPNGTRVVSASGDEIKLWDLARPGQLQASE